MAIQIFLRDTKFSYNAQTRTFAMSERHIIGFASAYRLVGKNSEKEFTLDHQTGSEWDVNTKYVYKTADGYTLEVANDKAITEARAESYLKHKLKH